MTELLPNGSVQDGASRPFQIVQVLVNLLNNACDAIHNQEPRWIKVAAETNDELLLLTVTDSGDGIPDDIHSRMMEPFFTTKGAGLGTGLGLSLSKGIVEDHGGRLDYDGVSPNTRFVIILPMKQKEARSAA